MPVDDRRVDPDLLLPIALKYRKKLQCDPEKWNDYEIEQIISECGPRWSSMSIENVRLQCCNLRKRGVLGTLSETRNHGAAKRESTPEWYRDYLQSVWWKQFRVKVLEWWGYRCCWCNSSEKVEVHHRTYVRLDHEQLQDCVCLCKHCHIVATRSTQRTERGRKAQAILFTDAEE